MLQVMGTLRAPKAYERSHDIHGGFFEDPFKTNTVNTELHDQLWAWRERVKK